MWFCLFLRKILSFSLLFIVYFTVSYFTKHTWNASSVTMIAFPLCLLWSLLSISIDRKVKSLSQGQVSSFLHHFVLAVLIAVGMIATLFFSIIGGVIFVLIVIMHWGLDRFITGKLLTDQAKPLLIYKYKFSIVVSIIITVYSLLSPPYFSTKDVLRVVLDIPTYLLFIAPLSWIIDRSMMHIKAGRWISLGIHVLASIAYITYDYGEIPFDNLYLISIYIGQILLFWFTNVTVIEKLSLKKFFVKKGEMS